MVFLILSLLHLSLSLVIQAYPADEMSLNDKLKPMLNVDNYKRPQEPSIKQKIQAGGPNNGFYSFHRQRIGEGPNFQVDGMSLVSKPLEGPMSLGGGLSYTHIPSRNGFSASSTNIGGRFNQLEVGPHINLFRSKDGNTDFKFLGSHTATFGQQRKYTPQFQGSLIFTHRY